jgi:hypothetical protein
VNSTVKPLRWTPIRWQDRFFDVAVPLVFALLTAGFFAMAAR